jgi:hypothetical protein
MVVLDYRELMSLDIDQRCRLRDMVIKANEDIRKRFEKKTKPKSGMSLVEKIKCKWIGKWTRGWKTNGQLSFKWHK